MAIDWADIRDVIHNIPIPKVGISINDAKDLYTYIKDNPGGVLVYEAPGVTKTPETGETIFTGVLGRSQPAWVWLVILGLILYMLVKK